MVQNATQRWSTRAVRPKFRFAVRVCIGRTLDVHWTYIGRTLDVHWTLLKHSIRAIQKTCRLELFRGLLPGQDTACFNRVQCTPNVRPMCVQCASNVRPTRVQCAPEVCPMYVRCAAARMARACRRAHQCGPCGHACWLRGVLGPGLPGAAQVSHLRDVCANALLRSSERVDFHAMHALPTTSVLVDLAACCQASLALLTLQLRVGHNRPELPGLPPATALPAYLETPYWPNLCLLILGLLLLRQSWTRLSGSGLPTELGPAHLEVCCRLILAMPIWWPIRDTPFPYSHRKQSCTAWKPYVLDPRAPSLISASGFWAELLGFGGKETCTT